MQDKVRVSAADLIRAAARGRRTPYAKLNHFGAAGCAICAVLAMPAYGQESAAANGTPDAAVGEIVVTAQRRAENVQDVPISIAVLGGDQLDQSAGQGVAEALQTVPGVSTLQSYQGGGSLVTIRGVTAGQALFVGAGTVGYYLDAVPFGAIKSAIAPDSSAYDLERVEVLRGPQGTLYGANALNGVVRVLTRPADLSRFGFKARASVAFTEGGSTSYRQDATVNIPVITDRLAVRATVGYQDKGGWIDTASGKDVNNGNLWNMRARLDAEPVDGLSLSFSYWRNRDKIGGPSTGEARDFNSTTFDQPIRRNFDTFSGKIAYDFGPFTATNAASYMKYSNDSIIDRFPLSGSRTALSTNSDVKVFSNELQLSSNGDGPWRWSLGGLFRDAKDELFQAIPQANFALNIRARSKSYAGFGEISRSFADGRFDVTGGLRYYHEAIDQTGQVPVTRPAVISPTDNSNAITPRIVLNWRPENDLTVYASYSQGFRSGFPQNSPSVGIPPARPDRLHNYEVGAKGSVLGGTVSFDSALYYIDWTDVQQNVTVLVNGTLPFAATVNGKSASGWGAEASVSLRPSEGLELSTGFGWNDLTSDADIFSGGVLLFPKGGRLNYSPKLNANAALTYAREVDAESGLMLRFGLSAKYTSKQLSRALLGNVLSSGASDRNIIADAKLALESQKGWTATIFAENLTDFKGVASPGFGGLAQYYGRARPRSFGLQLEFKY